MKYASKHHSEDDPGGIIRQVLDAGPEFEGPAEDILLAWTMRLGDGADAGAAAARLTAAYGIAEGPLPEGAAGRVVELLREAANYPQARMGRDLKRRRGGRRGRLE